MTHYFFVTKYFLILILFIFLYSRFLLVIYFIRISVYMSIPISQFIPPPECSRLMMTAIISNMDAVACVRKYLVEASIARGLKFFIMMGMIAVMCISNLIQASNQ